MDFFRLSIVLLMGVASRYSREARRTALTTYALTQLLGGSLCISTVTVRHNSAAMLRRIGGTGLEVDGVEIPRYYDPRYGCEMEILRFDSRHPGPKYQRPIEQVRGQLSMTPVICGLSQVERLQKAVAGLAVAAEREGATGVGRRLPHADPPPMAARAGGS